MPALGQRYPRVLHEVLRTLETQEAHTACLTELTASRSHFESLGLELPTWLAMAQGVQPPRRDLEHTDPGEWEHGWQYYLSNFPQQRTRDALVHSAHPQDAARYRSCHGRHNARWLTTVPTSEALVLCNPILQCLLRRRLGLPILPDNEVCEGRRCGA